MTEKIGDKTDRDTEQVSQVIVSNKDKKILLLKRSDDQSWQPNKWALPGGHVEEDEPYSVAGARETKEEAGIDVTNLQSYNFPEKEKETLHYFKADFEGDNEEVEINFEHSDYVWVSEDELDNYEIVASVKKLLKKIFTS